MELTDVVNSGSNIQKPMRALSSALIASALAVMACAPIMTGSISENRNTPVSENSNPSQINENKNSQPVENRGSQVAENRGMSQSQVNSTPEPTYQQMTIPLNIKIHEDAQIDFVRVLDFYNAPLKKFDYALTPDQIKKIAVDIAGETSKDITKTELTDYVAREHIELSAIPQPDENRKMDIVNLGNVVYLVDSTLVDRFTQLFNPTGRYFDIYKNFLDRQVPTSGDKKITPNILGKIADQILQYHESR